MPDDRPATHHERLGVPLRWWVQAVMVLALMWLAFVVAMPVWAAAAATALLVVVVVGLFLASGRARVRVADGELHAGRARIPVALLGPAEALDREATRRALGVEADARAYLLTRPYLPKAVRVPVLDPADPAPYWLISSRHPRRLVAAIEAARATSGPGPTTHPAGPGYGTS